MRAFERSLAQGMAVNGNGLGAVPTWLRAFGVVFSAHFALILLARVVLRNSTAEGGCATQVEAVLDDFA
jgi:hypothetical protein